MHEPRPYASIQAQRQKPRRVGVIHMKVICWIETQEQLEQFLEGFKTIDPRSDDSRYSWITQYRKLEDRFPLWMGFDKYTNGVATNHQPPSTMTKEHQQTKEAVYKAYYKDHHIVPVSSLPKLREDFPELFI